VSAYPAYLEEAERQEKIVVFEAIKDDMHAESTTRIIVDAMDQAKKPIKSDIKIPGISSKVLKEIKDNPRLIFV